MSRVPKALQIAGVVLAILIVLVMLISLAQLYADLYLASPLLANLFLMVLVALAIAAVGFAIYGISQLRNASQRRKSRSRPVVPDRKADAAQATLAALQRQIQQLQDDVARQALLERSQAIAQDWSERSLHIVVFGTGSTGKTSLVNALIGRVAGQVSAPIGTTMDAQTYGLRLRGLERRIRLTDTPGLSEASLMGTQREQQVRQLATEADLLLFVVDNDLRQSEFQTVRSLLDMGKRLILVVNKIDLYPESELAAILQALRQRCHPLIHTDDIVAIAAHPRPITLNTGESVSPSPLLQPLLERMAAVLRQDGEDLIADNILLQSQRLSDTVRQHLSEERQQKAMRVIDRFQWIGGGAIAVLPLPGADLIATAAVNAKMVVEIGRIYGCDLDLESGKELALSLGKTLVSLGVLKGAIELFSLALQTNVATFILGRAIQGATAAYLTRIAGCSFMTYFQQGQDWGDGGMAEVVQQQFQLNRRDEVIQRFVKDAIAQIVPTLQTDQSSLDADEKTGKRDR
jgi:small GTP-binding protein